MDKELLDLPHASRFVVSANSEVHAVSTVGRLPAAVLETPPVSPQCARQTSGQDLPSTTGEDVMVTSLRMSTDNSYGLEGYDDGEIVSEFGQPRILSTACPRQADAPELPVLAGHQARVAQLRENKRSADEQQVQSVPTEVVPVDETPPMLLNEYSQRRDSQELPLLMREDPASINLPGSEDYDRGLEAVAPSKDCETALEKGELHTSLSRCDRRTGEMELSRRMERQALIAYVHESAPSEQQISGILEAIPAGEVLRVLRCRCSEPIDEEDLTLPKDNVIGSLLENKFNCSVEEAQAQLKRFEEWRAKRWEEAAKAAGVKLAQRRVWIVYTTEKAMDNIKMEVPRQVEYVGTSPAILPSLADTPCTDLGISKVLQYLNCVLRTTYTLDQPGLASVLQNYADFDFGLAYGHLRNWWFEDFTQLQEKMRGQEAKDKESRDRAIDGAYIVNRQLPPRRAWDLYSNRVLPWWALREWDQHDECWLEMYGVDAVSHSWVHPDDRQYISTTINGGRWPVPIPKDTNLDRVRFELLNVGREVVWLDVLCLWQEGVTEDNAARLHEWELDVPTIGSVYMSFFSHTVVMYFNGLGRPFHIGNLDDERHWLNRAWTLQEFKKGGIIGGLVSGSFPPPMVNNQVNSDRNVVRFYHRLQSASNNSLTQSNVVLSVLAAMGPRYAAHVVDKVGGITHIFALGRIPKYVRGDEPSAAEDAWNLLIPVMDGGRLVELLFFYPGQGNGMYAWCPSWEQVNGPLPPVPLIALSGSLHYNEKDGRFQYEGWLIERCQVQGFAKCNPRGHCHTGTLQVVHHGAEHSFTVAAHHQEPITDGSYALIGERSHTRRNGPDVVVWVVGTFNSDKRFEKLSVLRTEDKYDIETLQNLGLIGERWLDESSKSSIVLV